MNTELDNAEAILTPWMKISDSEELADRIIALYEERGSDRYDEAVTQVEHALQCGDLAERAGASAETSLAAYLHDIGHLLLRAHERREENSTRDLHHEDIGGRFLANWFGDAVVRPVELHVPAKRYLCAVESTYFDGLSPGSVKSLELQGGPMTTEEAESFIGGSFAPEAVDLRRWDDLGKVMGAETQGLAHVRELIVQLAEVG